MIPFIVAESNEYITADYAPSGRSSCRQCKNKIKLQELRMGLCIEDDHFNGKYWYHVDCFSLKPRHKNIDAQYPESKVYNIEKLQKQDYDRVIEKMKEEIQRIKLGKKRSKSAKQQKTKVKKTDEQIQDDAQKKPKQKRNKNGKLKKKPAKIAMPKKGYNQAQKNLFKEYFQQFNQLSANQLKEILGLNRQSKTGKKQELVEKCADGKLLGVIPTCKTCGGGKLRFNRQTGVYSCPGYMEDTDFIRCAAKFQFEQIERQKWTDL